MKVPSGLNHIYKVVKIIPGGKTGQESIFNGLAAMEENCRDGDIVLIHDGVRPLITADLISENIKKVKESGSAITVSETVETVLIFTFLEHYMRL
jgi:2-C-methyl-D-erythritol 4-phosphate cytidylyltransferase